MSSLTVEEDQKWVPTHVQVTVLRGRGLRGKGKHGTSDVYTIIQLGKEKYSTCVAEKTTEPEWREECSFELQPGVLDRADRSGYPAGSSELVLTVMHRALIGLDVFLGQAAIQLDKLFGETRCVKNEWYRLNSKTGKKEKERGDIQVTVQFTRNNLTASMYDLVMKDKGASTFSKLKERMRGKRRASDEDSSSAVLPGGYGSLYRMRHRLPSDGGGEEDYEDDEGGEARRSKMRNFFLRGKLRKSSDTRSSTSLGSESSESSSRGGSLSPTAGISVVVSDLSNSPSNSSNLTADNSPEHTANTSPKSSSLHRCEFGEEAGEITIAVPQPTVCVNGSHAYNVQPLDPGSGKPADSLGLGVLQKPLPLSVSLQNLSPRASMDLPRSPVGDGRRWSFDKPDKEEKAAIAAALEQSGPMQGDEEAGGRLGQAVLPKAASTADLDNVKKQRRNLFSHGRSDSAGKGQSQSKERSGEATQEKHKGWLGSKDSHSKPSRVVSPKLEPSTDPHLPPLPSSQHPPGLPVHPPSLVSPLHHTNPFCHSQTASSLMSPANPFFCLLQHNPFYDDMLTAQPLKTSPPPLPYLSSSRPPIAQLFPQASNANPGHNRPTTEEPINVSGEKRDPATKVERRPLPPVPTEGGRERKPLSRKSSNPFVSLGEPESEWDESFEAFAAGRLQCPEDPTADCKTQQNTPSDEGMDADHNMNQSPNHQPQRKVLPEACKAPGQLTNTNTHHLDLFAHFLETIPEHRGFETDTVTSNTSADLPKLDAFTDTNQTGSTTNTKDFTNPHQVHCRTTSTQLSSSSPDPVSSGVGSSVEEDFLSCLSTSSDKFSASSSEEAEAHNFESNILGFGKSPENRKPSEAEDCSTGGTNDRSFPDVAQQTVIQQQLRDGGVDSNDSEEPLGTQSPTKGAEIESADTQTLNVSNIVYPDLLPNMSEIQPKPNSSSQSDGESREKGKNEYNSSVEELTGSSPSTFPSLHIITSSPDVRRDSLNLSFGSSSLGGQFTGWCSPEPFGGFGDFINTGSGPEFDKTLLHTPASEQSTSSFLQSLYVSADSQDYQTCESRLPSKSSELNQTLYSANSTLCGDLSEIHSTPDATSGLENSSKPANGEIKEADRSDESLCGGGDDKATTVLTMGDDSGLREPTAALDSSSTSCHPRRPSEGGVESPEVVLDDESSKRPQATLSTLHRSQSEGALTSLFDEVLLPSFGSDPGAVQESSLTQPGPDLPHLTSFDPPLTPDSRSSPVALSSSPPLAGASARLPPSTAPMPEETQQQQQRHQQQAANQQNSPHPVKPLTTAILAEEKRTEGRSVLATGLEKLKSTIHPGRSSQLSEQETNRKKCLTEGAGSYYHLTHSELVALLVQREAEMERQRAEFERQRVLLTKREVELRKLKPQVRDLEDYIDTLLVRIMEQKPTLLQVRSKYK